jgi:hypothetical protein
VNYKTGQNSSDIRTGYCGTPGQRAGLRATFMETDLQNIPYRQQIEVPFSLSFSGIPICHRFKDISIQIIATCEIPKPNSQVYQYAVKKGDVNGRIDYANVLGASNSTYSFDVAWAKPSSSRRLLDEDALKSVESKFQNLETKNAELHIQLANQMAAQAATQAANQNAQMTTLFVLFGILFAAFGCVTYVILCSKKYTNKFDVV